MEILNDVLDHSKIEAGKLVLSSHPTSIHGLARSVIALFRGNAEAKGVALSVDLDPRAADWVIADPHRLKQVLLNLVGNAIKFTERGFVTLSIQSGPTTADTSQVKFSVRDSGIGIPSVRWLICSSLFIRSSARKARVPEERGWVLRSVSGLSERWEERSP